MFTEANAVPPKWLAVPFTRFVPICASTKHWPGPVAIAVISLAVPRMTCVLNPPPSGVTNATPPVAPGVKVNMLLAAGVTRVHAPVALSTPNQSASGSDRSSRSSSTRCCFRPAPA